MAEFSDEPLVADGVKIKPKWPWSRQYRREVAETLRAQGRNGIPSKVREHRYIEWYADKHGISWKEARKRIRGRQL